jgi:hypothetical protein
MRLLKNCTLLLEVALYLLPLHAFELEGGLGHLTGGLLLLEQGPCRLVRTLLLPELLPRRGEQGDLVR